MESKIIVAKYQTYFDKLIEVSIKTIYDLYMVKKSIKIRWKLVKKDMHVLYFLILDRWDRN